MTKKQTDRPARAVLTLAIGKRLYFDFAVNLARSFLMWHRNSEIEFFVATDQNRPLPPDLGAVRRIDLRSGQFGHGFSPKLHLDEIAPAQETLFIDADCLCVSNLEFVFDRFAGHAVSVVGTEESDGELFGDIAFRCRAVGVSAVSRFCGGLYFLRPGDTCHRVFQDARSLELRYDELGLVRLRGVPNEEPLIALGMALHGQHPVPEDGTIKAEPMFFSGTTRIDVFGGWAVLSDSETGHKPFPDWKIGHVAKPAIVHFNCMFAERPPYTTEVCRLEKVLLGRWPISVATAYAKLTRSLPYALIQGLKDLLRPVYHSLFGVRRVKTSPRIA